MSNKDILKENTGQVGRFVIVGIINTLIGCVIMFCLYNLAGCSYWLSSATNYFLTSILSYFLNKRFTFKHKGDVAGSAVRFAINIAVCYFLAYGIAKPLTLSLTSDFGWTLKLCENIAMAVGMCLFTAFNFVGQKVFAFKK